MPNNAYTALQGGFGLGKQSAQGTVASSITYLPALSIGLEPNQIVQTRQPEIGGSLFLRGSYKGGVSGGGNISFYPLGDSVGQIIMALCGQDTPTAVPGQSGAYEHVFAPVSFSGGQDLPWYTLQKNVSGLWTNQFLDSKLDTLTFDISKQQIVTSSATWFSLQPSEIPVPGSMTFDNSSDFVACSGAISFLDETSQTNISSSASVSFERINLTFRNNLSNDQFVVGSYYPTGATLLQRTANVSLDLIIRDKNLYEAIYQNGGSSSWSPTIKRAALTVTLTAATNIGTTTQPWQLVFTFPGLDLMMMPVTPSGAQLLRSSITSQVTLGPSGADTYGITLYSSIASY